MTWHIIHCYMSVHQLFCFSINSYHFVVNLRHHCTEVICNLFVNPECFFVVPAAVHCTLPYFVFSRYPPAILSAKILDPISSSMLLKHTKYNNNLNDLLIVCSATLHTSSITRAPVENMTTTLHDTQLHTTRKNKKLQKNYYCVLWINKSLEASTLIYITIIDNNGNNIVDPNDMSTDIATRVTATYSQRNYNIAPLQFTLKFVSQSRQPFKSYTIFGSL